MRLPKNKIIKYGLIVGLAYFLYKKFYKKEHNYFDNILILSILCFYSFIFNKPLITSINQGQWNKNILITGINQMQWF